jgi:hypothetical protein
MRMSFILSILYVFYIIKPRFTVRLQGSGWASMADRLPADRMIRLVLFAGSSCGAGWFISCCLRVQLSITE